MSWSEYCGNKINKVAVVVVVVVMVDQI